MYRKRCIYYYKIIITNSFRKGEKKTSQEFIAEKERENLKIYNLLKDDIENGIVYQIHRIICGEKTVNMGLFRRFYKKYDRNTILIKKTKLISCR